MYPIWLGSDLLGACVLGTRYIAQTSRLLLCLKRWDDRNQAQKSARKHLVKFDEKSETSSFFHSNPNRNSKGHKAHFDTFQNSSEFDQDVEESSVLTAPPL